MAVFDAVRDDTAELIVIRQIVDPEGEPAPIALTLPVSTTGASGDTP